MQVGEYVISRGIENEPAFSWWVPYAMQKRDVIVSAVKLQIKKATHKYGVEIPLPGKDVVQYAIDLDRQMVIQCGGICCPRRWET